MKVLLACEFSGQVRDRLIDLGVDAWSCDLINPEFEDDLPCGVHTDRHIVGDVRRILNDGWHTILAFPPCTYVTNTGVQWLYHPDDTKLPFWERRPHPRHPHRREQLRLAVDFFNTLWRAKCQRLSLENPIPHKYASIPPYTQIVQPWWFGELREKATCLWLKGLPLLKPTHNVKNHVEELPYYERQWSQAQTPSENRGLLRSVLYDGLADAMVNQWF